jgi:hypothetical protein
MLAPRSNADTTATYNSSASYICIFQRSKVFPVKSVADVNLKEEKNAGEVELEMCVFVFSPNKNYVTLFRSHLNRAIIGEREKVKKVHFLPSFWWVGRERERESE